MPHDQLDADRFPEPQFLEGAKPSQSECTLAMLAHLGGLLFSFIPPAILMITQQDKSHFVVRHAREAVNYQLTLFFHAFILYIPAVGIGVLVSLAVGDWKMGVLAGCAVALVLSIVMLIFEIMLIIRACMAAGKGQEFRYPLTIRLI